MLRNVVVPAATASPPLQNIATACVSRLMTLSTRNNVNGDFNMTTDRNNKISYKDQNIVMDKSQKMESRIDRLPQCGGLRQLSTSTKGNLAAILTSQLPEGKPTSEDSPDVLMLYDTLRIYQLVRGYQMRGYLHADLDPLQLPINASFFAGADAKDPSLAPDYRRYGFTEEDLDKDFDCGVPGSVGFLDPQRPSMKLRDLIRRLKETYQSHIGAEFAHMANREAQVFFREKFETPEAHKFDHHFRRRILARTMRACLFEQYCAQKFSTVKRFGCDGIETMIVAMKEITKNASATGVESVIVGMAHRGRLNVLMNVMHKPMQQLVNEFQGRPGFGKEEWGSLGDVKYHMGVTLDHFDVDSQRKIRMTLLANPSHLEAVNPLVCGQARAQMYFNKLKEEQVLPVMFHGDASIAGQGVIYETLQMSKLKAYSVGGTIHIVVNNQIGFTTNSSEAGSGQFCTSIARAIDAPVLHVNADDPEAVTRVARIAFDYRQKFKSDVFINLIGFRRYGHNELDMPKFTQPEMYRAIDNHKSVLEIYSDQLKSENVIDQKYFDDLKKNCLDFYNKQYETSKNYDTASRIYSYTPEWSKMARPIQVAPYRITGVPMKQLKEIGVQISTLPKNFTAHPTIDKLYRARVDAVKSGTGIDFGLAEALAYATLLKNNNCHVRLAGQDAQRGTFSHRHSVVHEQNTFETYCPLQNLGTQAQFHIFNSLLSEYAALGFEVGYSLENPNALVIWEAQFGDFANGAQIAIDQFIASGEVKWARQCGITLLLPHGYDGQGPEHSSARIERFLQLCDDREDVIDPVNWDPLKRTVIQKHNMQIVQPSTPANHFHVLRRQVIRDFRKPLVIFSPKKMLKLRAATSNIDEIADGTKFIPYIADVKELTTPKDTDIKRLILCSGQLYYDLVAQRQKLKQFDVAIARFEQLSPFPYPDFIDDVARYPHLKSLLWVQDEPMNAGPWNYVSSRIKSALDYLRNPQGVSHAIYVGRDVSGAPSVGDPGLHANEIATILRDAFDMSLTRNSHYDKYTKGR